MRHTALKAVLMICLAAAWILPGCQKKQGSPSVPPPPATGFPQIEASGSASWTGAAKPESFALRWQATDANHVMIPDLEIVGQPLKGAVKIPTDSPGLTIAAYYTWSVMMLKHVSVKVTHDTSKDSYSLSATSTLLSPKPLLGPPYQFAVPASAPSEFVPVVFSFFQGRRFLVAEVGYTEGFEGDFVFTTNYQELPSERNLHHQVRYQLTVEDHHFRRQLPIRLRSRKEEKDHPGWFACTLRGQIQQKRTFEREWQNDEEFKIQSTLKSMGDDFYRWYYQRVGP